MPGDLEALDGLVIPGGESTTMTLGIEREGLAEPLRELAAAGCPMLGSCAGLIMLDREHLGLMDIRAERNAFGRQIRSFEADVELRGLDGGPLRGDLHPRAVDRRARPRRRDPRRARRPSRRGAPGADARRRLPQRARRGRPPAPPGSWSSCASPPAAGARAARAEPRVSPAGRTQIAVTGAGAGGGAVRSSAPQP